MAGFGLVVRLSPVVSSFEFGAGLEAEEQISPLRFASIEMTTFGFGPRSGRNDIFICAVLL